MNSWFIFDRLFTIELRNGVGVDLEFVDSRPVWAYNSTNDTQTAMAFEGTILLIPFFMISLGRVYAELED
ncbi:MAG: hypothetical protein CME84_16140 [Henriciella sp.]|nr:hypothetical protein [Henriciella sp.]